MKYWQHWERLQHIPNSSIFITSDKDTAWLTTTRTETFLYCDGSNHFREWLENLLAIPMKKTWYGMFYSYGNVAKEMVPKIYNILNLDKPITIIGHSRGVFGLGIALKLFDLGVEIKEVILYGPPRSGNAQFVRECESRGIKITVFIVDGDWVTRRPFFGKSPKPTTFYKIKNTLKLRRIKDKHLSYGRYLKELDL